MKSLVSPGLALGAALLTSSAVFAMQAPSTFIDVPGADLAAPAFPWPREVVSIELQRQIGEYKGAYAAELKEFYTARSFQPLWVQRWGWGERARQAIIQLGNAQREGLNPKDYLKPAFTSLETLHSSDEKRAGAELDLTLAVLAYAKNLMCGRIEPSRVSAAITARPPEFTPAKLLADLADNSDVEAVLDSYEPPHPGYKSLKTALGLILDEQGAVPEKPVIPEGPVLSLGRKDERVPMLRARFALNESENSSAPVMDASLVAAVRDFQQENGLIVTGSVGTATLRALNDRGARATKLGMTDLIVNMERWRWLPRDLGEFRVVVNIPEFLVRVQDGDVTNYEGRVVVGKPQTSTPIFSDDIEYVVVNPSWHVPPSIAQKELLPLLISDPEAFARRGIEVRQVGNQVSFRQPPSERNALGRIKFMFPNQHSVYLHDTPAKGYFQRDVRAFSHGCVRVANPLRFADALMVREPNLNGDRLARLFGRGEQFLYLKTKIPVHIVYFTVFSTADGSIGTRGDIYGVDAKMKNLLGLRKRG